MRNFLASISSEPNRLSSRSDADPHRHDVVVSSSSSSPTGTGTQRYRWRSVGQSTAAMMVATLLAVYGSRGLWEKSRDDTRDALVWSDFAAIEAAAVRDESRESLQTRDRIAALQQWVKLLRQESEFDDEESESAENLMKIMESLKEDELNQSYGDNNCDTEQNFFCDFWSHFDLRHKVDTTHWKNMLSDAQSAEHQLAWLSIRSQQLRTAQETEAQQLQNAQQHLTSVQAVIAQNVKVEEEDREKSALYFKKAVSKAKQASLVAMIALLFLTYSVVRLVASVPLADYGRYAGLVLERRHVVFACQHELIWLLVMVLMNEYLGRQHAGNSNGTETSGTEGHHKPWQPFWVMFGTAIIAGFAQLLHATFAVPNLYPSTMNSTGGWWTAIGSKLVCFCSVAWMHTLICFFVFGRLILLDWHVRMALLAALIFSWYTKQGCLDHGSVTWTSAVTTEETSTLATEASPILPPTAAAASKYVKEGVTYDEGSVVYVEDVSSSRACNMQTWALVASWDALVLTLGYRLICMVGPIAWQVNPMATVFAEALFLYVTVSNIRWPTTTMTTDPALPRTIHV